METRYLQPGIMTGLGGHAAAVRALPGDFEGLARVVQGLLIHEFWADQYGVTLTDDDRQTVHLRPAELILDAVVARDDRPLDVPRAPAERTATNCRGFTVLTVAMLRAHGVPARARCGFGAYFIDGFFEDHWVVEYHDGQRWRRGDAQIDDVQRAALGIDFDLSDLGDRFVVGGEAWRRVRSGSADPEAFGLSGLKEGGEWWIAGNVLRDAAALAGVELLPWDAWGIVPGPDDPLETELLDEVAAATPETVGALLTDERLRVPGEVFNVLRRRREPLAS